MAENEAGIEGPGADGLLSEACLVRPKHRHGREIAPGGVPSARDLRQPMTKAEEVLWTALRDRRMAGLKFRRQHPLGPFVVDFCCPTALLVVEVDGGVQDEQVEQDEFRTHMLTSNGYRVIRFRNDEVLTDLSSVLDHIQRAASVRHAQDVPTHLTSDVATLPSPAHGRGALWAAVGSEGNSVEREGPLP